ncbi:receptor-type tyrosine-protein phosphatase H isoform X2 [Larimichthys crocea]|uniref:receptor-type tyrosine-protein phosphatase H isoform X2 n=1 Tax=Larimichthys crocea TaxID=215358 RepID=UPI000F5EBAC8|nr:receptor-type tyrosine-protein phosphatase H isoform X2 [Larimichthys crocea]
MKSSYFKTTSDCFLLCVFLLLWVGGETVSNSTTNSTEGKVTTAPVTTLLSTRLTTKSPPPNAEDFKSIGQSESSITLQWGRVEDFLNYTLRYNEIERNVTVSVGDVNVTETIQELTSGTEYNFTLYTVFGNVKSSGVNLTAVTAPCDTDTVKAIDQNETSITLQWGRVENFLNYTLRYNEIERKVTASAEDVNVTETIQELTSGTEYTFTLYTVFGNVKSSGVNLTAVTAPRDTDTFEAIDQNETSITLQWGRVEDFLNYTLRYNEIQKSISAAVRDVDVTETIQGLTGGTEYTFTLYTVFKNVRSSGVHLTKVTDLPDAEDFKLIGQNKTSITLQWRKVEGFLNYTLRYNKEERNVTASAQDVNVTETIQGLTNGTEYTFTLYTVNGSATSSGVNLTAVTAPLDAEDFKSIGQNETSITLQWGRVGDFLNYTLRYNEKERNVTASADDVNVTETIQELTSGTEYTFTLYTVFKNVRSSGVHLTKVTAPPDAKDFESIGQNETSITLQWEKVEGFLNYTLRYNETERNVTASAEDVDVTEIIQELTSGTEYTFTLYTVFEDAISRGVHLTAVTAPSDANGFKLIDQNETSITLQWGKVGDLLNYMLRYNETQRNVTASAGDVIVTETIQELTSGTEYTFTLYTVFGNVKSIGVNLTAVTAPSIVNGFKSIDQNETSITLQWGKVGNILNYMLRYNETQRNVTASAGDVIVTETIQELTSGTEYTFTLYTVFGNVKSSGVNLTAVTAPRNTGKFQVIGQNETSITLQWGRVEDFLNYTLRYNEIERNVTASADDVNVTETIQELTSGTKYTFTLYTVFGNVKSSGVDLTAATVPSMVALVTVTECSATQITLKWNVDVDKDWRYLLQMNEKDYFPLRSKNYKNVITFTVSSLKPGTSYPFRVTTMFFGLNSTVYNNFAVTAINCTSIPWHVTNSSIQGMVQGLFTNARASNKSDTHVSPGGSKVTFTGLYPGATYDLFFEYENHSTCVPSCSSQVTTIPPNLNGHCENWASGYSIYIEWNNPDGVWTAVEVNVAEKTFKKERVEQHIIIPGFQPAKKYKVSLASVSGSLRSEPVVFWCLTDARGVIAGSVFAVLLFVALVCLLVIFLLKRPDIIRKKSFISGSKQANKKSKAISVANFPDHFKQLSGDENRGFSQEYENLSTVGTEQTRKEAERLDNKPKNRFNNVLPYDWCRVKLTTSNPNEPSDYINANYMPGYNSNREYIAAQGPLPTTVNDFWRMIWEQKVNGIAMVTNCTEGGRTKCEQYWPADNEPRLYGRLSVTMNSEQQEAYWTLREFRVKHITTSEERTVRHFHFTAWPDHGVPQGTEFLIHFRGLVRDHIQTEGTGAPTVVHCSAGVGRTGTLIALDVFLQQLEKEKAVGINSFVHKMRQSRPLMVQTESQYVFLHQCIMDSLQQNKMTEDNIYENADMIYENATVLREFNRNA